MCDVNGQGVMWPKGYDSRRIEVKSEKNDEKEGFFHIHIIRSGEIVVSVFIAS